MEIRTKLTLAEAITLYPLLNNEPIELKHYPTDGYYPSWAQFELTGDGYRSRKVYRFDAKVEKGGE